MLVERRRRPTDDLTSALLQAELDGDRLTADEIIGFLFLIVVAGNETTTKLLGERAGTGPGAIPIERAKPFADAARIPDWIEETLRYDTSTQMLARTAVEDFELHGGCIPAGGRVVLSPRFGQSRRPCVSLPRPLRPRSRHERERRASAPGATSASARPSRASSRASPSRS